MRAQNFQVKPTWCGRPRPSGKQSVYLILVRRKQLHQLVDRHRRQSARVERDSVPRAPYRRQPKPVLSSQPATVCPLPRRASTGHMASHRDVVGHQCGGRDILAQRAMREEAVSRIVRRYQKWAAIFERQQP